MDNINKQITNKDQYYTNKFSGILLSVFSKYSAWQSKLTSLNTKIKKGSTYNQRIFNQYIDRIAEKMQQGLDQITQYIDRVFEQLSEFLLERIKDLDQFNYQYEQLFGLDNFRQNRIINFSFDFYNSFNDYFRVAAHDNQMVSKIVSCKDKIIVASFDKSISVWNSELGLVQRLPEVHQSWIRALTVFEQKEKQYLLSSADDQKFCIFSIDTNNTKVLQPHKEIGTLAYSRQAIYFDNKILSPGGQRQNHDILIYSLETNEYIQRLSFHKALLTSLKSIPNYIIMSTDSVGYTVRWQLKNNRTNRIHFKKLNNISCSDYVLVFNVFGTETGKLIIASNKMKQLRIIKLSKSKILHIQIIDSQHILYICKPDYFCLYNIKLNETIKKVKLPEIDEITAFNINVPLGILIFGDKRGRVFLFNFRIYLQII